MSSSPSYYAIIPANVRYDKNLCANSKLLYGEITALCNDKGFCWASNNYFSNLYGVSKETVSRWMTSLQKRGYIHRDMIREGSQIVERRIFINTPIDEKINTPCENNQEGIDEKINTPIDEKIKENTTLINTTVNITENSPDPEIIKLVQMLYSEIMENTNPVMWIKKPPNLKSWYSDIEKMYRIDKMSFYEIEKLIKWVARDSFWKNNIKSGYKLRSKNIEHDLLSRANNPSKQCGFKKPGIGFDPNNQNQASAIEKLINGCNK